MSEDIAKPHFIHNPWRGRTDRKLLGLLVCPLTKKVLHYDAERQELISATARLAYPIRDGVPILLPDEARSVDVA